MVWVKFCDPGGECYYEEWEFEKACEIIKNDLFALEIVWEDPYENKD